MASHLRTFLILAIGAVVGVILGFFVYAAPGGGRQFGSWLFSPIRYGVWTWAVFGAGLAAAVMFIVGRKG